MPDGPVMLGYISGGWGRMEWFNSMFNAVSGPYASRCVGGVMTVSAGPLVALSRNLLAARFLDSPLEWLCTTDTDIVFNPDAVDRLFEVADPEERPIVSGLYYVLKDSRLMPAAYVNMSEAPELDLRPLAEPDKVSGVIRVAAVGCGFMLIHRSVFEVMRKRISDGGQGNGWYRETVIDGEDIGEDISFCLRAMGMEIPVYLNADVRLGHVKSAMIGGPN